MSRVALVSLLALVAALLSVCASAEHIIPLPTKHVFKQCDETWRDLLMGNKTICEVGCYMSSLASAVRDHGIKFQITPFGTMPVTSNPGTFNEWLRENDGYEVNSLKNEDIKKLCQHFPEKKCHSEFTEMHRENDLTVAQVQALLNNYVTIAANVNKGGHFVRVLGWDSEDEDTIVVMDPGYNRDTYSHSKDIVGWRIFALQGIYTPDIQHWSGDMNMAVREILGKPKPCPHGSGSDYDL